MRTLLRSAVRFALFGATALGGLVATPAPALADGPAEKALPASTYAYLKIENAAKLREEFQSSQLGQLAADPAIQPLKDDILSRLEEPSKQLKEKLGITLQELLTLPQGPIQVAIVGREAADGKPPVALIASADAGENADKMTAVMAKATAEAEKGGNKVLLEDFKDLKFTTITAEEGKDPLIWTKSGSVFHIASDAGALKDFLANASGRTESLAANDNYQNVLKAVGESSQVSLFLDVTKLIELGVNSAPNGNPDQLKGQLQLTGIDKFKAAGLSFNFNKGDYDQVIKMFLYSPGPAQGLLKIFAMPPTDLKPPAWVPASANSYQAVSFDFDAAWKGITELADQFGAGGFIEQAQNGIGGPNGNFDFKKDLFAPLGGRITSVSDFKKPITEKSQRLLFSLALDDEKTFQGTFNKLLELTQVTPKKRDFQGTTIYDFDVPNIPNAGAANINLEGPISVAITKGNLFVSTEPTFLEQVLRPGGTPLADSTEFQAVAKQYPSQTSVISYDRTEEQARLVYDMIKNGGLQQAFDQANAVNPDAKAENPIDPKKIPDFSIFSKYLAPGGSFGVQDEQGLTITSFMLRKAKP